MANLYRPEYRYKDETRQSAVWWYSSYRDGKRIRRSTGKRDKAAARQVMHQQLGADRLPPKLAGCTLAHLRELIENDYKRHGRRSLPRVNLSFNALEAHFGKNAKPAAIDTAAVVAYADARLEAGRARATINKELSALRRAFNLAVQHGMLPPASVPKITALKGTNVRTHFVNNAEMKRLAAKLPDELEALAYVGYLTGWRRGEMLSRRWKHLDMKEGWLRLNPGETKSGAGRQFPLTPELRRVFERQEKKARALWGEIDPEAPLFFHYEGRKKGRAIHSHYKAWRKAAKEAGLEHITMHDLRRSCIRNLVRAGVSETVAMRLSGHKTRSTFDRYDIVSEDDLLQAGDMLSAYVGPGKQSKNRSKETKKTRYAKGM